MIRSILATIFLLFFSVFANAQFGGNVIAPSTSATSGWTDGGGNMRTAPSALGVYTAETEWVTPAAAATDFAAFTAQSWSTTPYVASVEVSCVSTAASAVPVRLMYTDNTYTYTGSVVSLAGTPPTDTVHYTNTVLQGYVTNNSNRNRGAQAIIWYWKTNPNAARNGVSMGPLRKLLDTKVMNCAAGSASGGLPTAAPTPIVFDLTHGGMTRGLSLEDASANLIVVNLNGQTLPDGFAINVKWVWTQLENPVVAYWGDSSVASALWWLNGNSVSGGCSKNGSLDGLVNCKNVGSNGIPLQQALTNTGGATGGWPLTKVLSTAIDGSALHATTAQTTTPRSGPDIWVLTWLINDFRAGVEGTDYDSMLNRGIILLDCTINAILNGTIQGNACTSQYATAYPVSTMTWSNGLATITTTGFHQFYAGETSADNSVIGSESVGLDGSSVTISGSTNPNCNGTYGLSTVNSTTQFVITMASNPGGACTGTITEQFAIVWPATLQGNPSAKIILYSPQLPSSDDFGTGPGPNCYSSLNLNGAGTACVGGFSSTFTRSRTVNGVVENPGCTNNPTGYACVTQFWGPLNYLAYHFFDTNNNGSKDSRVYAILHKSALGGGPFPGAVINAASGAVIWYQNSIHLSPTGQDEEGKYIAPTLLKAINAYYKDTY